MTAVIKMEFDKWSDEFEPLTNHLDPDASVDYGNGGIMFETYGAELDYVLFMAKTKPLHVWTYMDAKDYPIVSEGYHLVNRIGYFITEKPAEPDTHYTIYLS